MNITQPEKSIKISDDHKVAIEEGKNRITLLEAEQLRLAKLINSQKTEINRNQAYLKDNVDKEDELKKKLEKITSQIKTAESELSDKNLELEIISQSISTINSQIINKKQELVVLINSLDKREKEVSQKESLLLVKEIEYNDKSIILDKKIEALKQVIL